MSAQAQCGKYQSFTGYSWQPFGFKLWEEKNIGRRVNNLFILCVFAVNIKTKTSIWAWLKSLKFLCIFSKTTKTQHALQNMLILLIFTVTQLQLMELERPLLIHCPVVQVSDNWMFRRMVSCLQYLMRRILPFPISIIQQEFFQTRTT